MSDDLVKRLRDVAGVIIGAQSQNLEEDYRLAGEAADRIEQLKAALREAMNDTPGWYDLARAALEGKKDD